MDAVTGQKATAVTRPYGAVPVGGTAATLAFGAFVTSVEQSRTRKHFAGSGATSPPRSTGRRSLRARRQSAGYDASSPSINNLLTAANAAAAGARVRPSLAPPPEFVQNVINNAPGSFVDDDGSPDVADRYNFYAHGRRLLFATNSLWYFGETSAFRRRVVWLTTSRTFEQVVLALIFANSIILALPDLAHVQADGDLDTDNSLRNAVVSYADVIFTAIFAVECTLKIIAMGLFIGRGAYLMDPWNWIDFVVVFVGIIAVIPGIPNVSGLRALRVLRPLRFFNAVPGIKKLVTALLRSIPELLSVVAFLSFLFFLYGVVGVQLWSGVFHARCRLTPFPVVLDPTLTFDQLEEYQARVIANATAFRCREENGQFIPLDDSSWTHESSPWYTPRVCYWPVADNDDDAQTCNIDYSNSEDSAKERRHKPFRSCPGEQTCGSDYDNFGNFRFIHPDETINRVALNIGTYTPNLNYGITSFDSIGSAALILFVCMPREGWSDIMYTLGDAGYGTASAVYFITFVLFGSFFMLNLALAVIWENFSDQSFIEAEEERVKNELEAGKFVSMKEFAPVGLSPIVSRSGVPQVRLIVEHWICDVIRTLLILLNTVILSLDQYPIDDGLSHVVDILNFFLTIAFTIDAVLKFIGLGFKPWKDDGCNIFDAIVVIISVTEVCLSPPHFLKQNVVHVSSFSGLRSVRIFALFKLARFWPSLQKLLSTIVSTIKEIGNFSVLLLLFMYIYALIGMQVFGNRFRFDEHGYPLDLTSPEAPSYIPRANFDTILWSMVTIFQILTGENWTNVMIDGWRSTGWSCVIYFISLVVLGNFILLNLFLAILLGNFEDQQEDVERLAIEKDELRRKSRVMLTRPSITSGDLALGKQKRKSSNLVRQRNSKSLEMQNSFKAALGQGNGSPTKGGTAGAHAAPMSALALAAMNQKNTKTVLSPEQSRPRNPAGRSLYLFGPRSWVRKNAWAIMHHPHFDKILLVLVLTSTVAVVLDNPLTLPESIMPDILLWADLVLTTLFLVEVLIKIVAQGLFFNTDAYLTNYWNVMDFVITIISVFGLQADNSQFKFLKTLRTFRALRPLRLINRNAGMKLVVSSLFAAIPQIVNVLMVVLLMLTIFSILAVNNLKGKLYSCNGEAFDALSALQQQLVTYPRAWSNLTEVEQSWFVGLNTSAAYSLYDAVSAAPTSRMVCGWLNATWSRTIPQSFDNVLLGWRTFFEISTTEGWVTIMLASVDATDIDMQPRRNYRERWTMFFIVFIFCGSSFVIQLFIGVVIENFNRMKEKLDGTFLLSSSQREWLMISDAILNTRPLRKMKTPRNKIRKVCFRVALSQTLETVTMGCIILNTFVMALHYFGEEDLYRMVLDYSNYFFTFAFTVEAAVKIIGLGAYYWKDSWNIFDFAVVVSSFFGMFYTWISGNEVGTSATTIRSFRVARLVKLIQTWPSLRQLTNTLIITLPPLVSIGGLLFLVFFIYAALGVQLFAKVKMGTLVTPHTNFQSISLAMITLMRCATGERWNDLMHELASNEDCVNDPAYDASMCGFSDSEGCVPLNGCGTQVAYIYFCSFTVLVTFVLLNILIAVILEGFTNEKYRASGVLLPQQYENFVTTWSVFDPDATGYLEWHILPRFLQELDEPLGFGPEYEASMKEMQAFINYLDFAIYGVNKVYFFDVARKLGKFVLDIVNDSNVEDLPSNIEVDQKWRTLLKGSKIRKMERATHRLNHIQAAIVIHEAVTSAVFREELKARVIKFTQLTSEIIPPSAPESRSLSPHRSPKRKASRRTSSGRLDAALEAAKADIMSRHSHCDTDDERDNDDGGAFTDFFE